jgi:simple sugar transport system permease protein
MDGDLGTGLGWWGVPLAVLSGAIRVGTPFLLVSLGECITEKSGRINVGLEGVLILGAMAGFATAFHTGDPWLGVVAAAIAGAALGLVHSTVCSLARANDIAVGIAIMLFGIGLAFFFGKPYLHPPAPKLPELDLGFWVDNPQLAAALRINALFLVGLALVPLVWALLYRTRWGLKLRTVGDSRDAALAMGLSVETIRAGATAVGGSLGGIAGAFLSLYYPGAWNEGLATGQGLMAVVLVIFARWSPLGCLWAALLFGGAGALSPALQSVGITEGYELIAAAPYALTLLVMILTARPGRSLKGAPGELLLNDKR